MRRRTLIAANGLAPADDFRSVLEGAGYEIEVAPNLELLLSTSDRLRSISEDLSGTREALNRALAELRKGEAVLQSIVDHSPAVVSAKDLQGRYILVNRRFEELFGMDRGEALSKTDRDLFPREPADRFRANDVEALRAGRPIEAEEVLLHDDRSRTFASLRFPILTAAGETIAVGGISIDIVERKNTQEELAPEQTGARGADPEGRS